MTPDPVKAFIKAMSDIDRSKHRTEVFRDFAELSYCAFAKTRATSPERAEALEAQYMDVVKRYRDPDDIRRMPELLGIAVSTLSVGGCDFLGAVAGEIGALNGDLGQFFTPYEVSRMMAEITLSDADAIIEREGFMTVSEPAAGAGGMLLAVADVIEGRGFNLETQVWFEAVELSRSTYHLAYIQLSARGLAGLVVCGNSLSLETYETAYTAATPVFLAANGDPFAKQKQAAKDAAERREREKAEALERLGTGEITTGWTQQSLFDLEM